MFLIQNNTSLTCCKNVKENILREPMKSKVGVNLREDESLLERASTEFIELIARKQGRLLKVVNQMKVVFLNKY